MAEDRELLARVGVAGGRGGRLLERVEKAPPAKGYVLFETGYGPSGLPHIGTFAEVFRSSLVRQAFPRLSDLPTRLFAFSMTWTACARSRTTSRTPIWSPSTSKPLATSRTRRRGRELRPQHERTSEIVSGRLRLRVRVRERGRVLPIRAVQRGAPACSSATTRSSRSSCRHSVPSARKPTARSCRSHPKAGAC